MQVRPFSEIPSGYRFLNGWMLEPVLGGRRAPFPAEDICNPLSKSLVAQHHRQSEGLWHAGQGVWYWDRDPSQLRGGEWVKAKVIEDQIKPPMVVIEVKGESYRVNQSKLRKNPDPWPDVVIQGVDNRDTVATVPGVPGQDSPINALTCRTRMS